MGSIGIFGTRRARLSARLLSGAAGIVVMSAPWCSAQAQQAADKTPQDIIVSGRSAVSTEPGGGLLSAEIAPKAVQSISRDFIAKQSPTVNAQQMLAMLPSANVSDTDPYGLQPSQSYVRGMDSTEIAWILEGAPLNDIGTGSFFAEEYVEAEDLSSVTLQPGSVSLDTPTVNATAGQVVMTMQDPSHKFGGLVDGSLGSSKMSREYIRINTGDIGASGLRGFVSYSHTRSNNWAGPGDANKNHVNAKFVKDFDNGSHASLVFAYNYEIANFYRAPTKAQFATYGNGYTYAATYTPGNSTYYKLQVNPFANVSASAPMHWVLGDKLSFDDTPYIWNGVGSGAFGVTATQGSTYVGNQKTAVDLGVPTGTAVAAIQIGQDNQQRLGNTAKLTFKAGANASLTAGWWYQHANQHFYTRIGQIDQTTGNPLDIWGNSGYYTYGNGTPYDWRNFKNNVDVNMLFAGGNIDAANGKLHIEPGLKYAIIASKITSFVPGANQVQRLTTRRLLPQLGASWKLDDHSQIYATLATNFRTPAAASLVNLYSRATGALTQGSGPSRPEYSFSHELGYRYNGDVVIASTSVFHYHFKDRQLSLNEIVDGAQLAQTINAGSQDTWGIDAQIGTKPIFFHLRPYLTFEYLDAKIGDNLPVTSTLGGVLISDYLPTKGKSQIASPHEQAGFGLDYDDGHLFINFQAKYIAKQYSTFMNDEVIPSYISTKLGMGYRLPSVGAFKGPQIQANFSNLANNKELTGVSSFQTNATPTTGLRGGTVAAGNPTYYLMPSFSAVVTLSSAF